MEYVAKKLLVNDGKAIAPSAIGLTRSGTGHCISLASTSLVVPTAA
jgi:hypothetical protein